MVSKELRRYWYYVERKSDELQAQVQRLFTLRPVHVTDFFN